MTLSAAAPGPAVTSTGSLLPFVALPQTELLTVNEQDIPEIRDGAGPGVHFKPLRLDVEAGEWVVLVTFEPGTRIPLHYHTGPAEVYTLAGQWNYAEYPDQPQTAGSYLYEPAGSVHTLLVPETNTENTVLFVRVAGTNINFTDDAQFHSLLDASSLRYLTDTLAAEQGLGDVPCIGGGAAEVTAGR